MAIQLSYQRRGESRWRGGGVGVAWGQGLAAGGAGDSRMQASLALVGNATRRRGWHNAAMSQDAPCIDRTDLPLPHRRAGKVRDVYDAELRRAVTAPDGTRYAAGTPVTVLAATDRLSAFDVVMPNGVPGKGAILTAISRFWFERVTRDLGGRPRHHAISFDAADVLDPADIERLLPGPGRVTLGRRCRVLPVECVVRGYLAGSGWKQYQREGRVCGVALPAGLRQCDRLPEPIFTPTSKAAAGEGHDAPMSFAQVEAAVGAARAAWLRDVSIDLYRMGHEYALGRGIILADTKFEFGLPIDSVGSDDDDGDADSGDGSDRPILIDELLTPDSSRFWPADGYEPGRDQPSFDKQFVRDYLQGLCDRGDWDKTAPGPRLPDEVVQQTRDLYEAAARRLGVAGY